MGTLMSHTGKLGTKPEGFNPKPTIGYTIEPVQKIPFNLWHLCMRANLEDAVYTNRESIVKDTELVTKHYLKPDKDVDQH